MKRYLVLAFVAFAVAIAAPNAFATHVIFDPPPPGGTDCTISIGAINDFTPCNISEVNTPYAVEFVACNTLTGLSPPVSSGWCLFMTNVTRRSLDKFTFNFTVPAGGSSDGTDALTCGSRPLGFATDNCADGSHAPPGDVLDLSFFATLPNNTNFYLITDFNESPGSATVTVYAPEPGELGLFGLGLLALGVAFGFQKRCQIARHNEAA